MAEILRIQRPTSPINTEIKLSSSKSESNRALIINAITGFKGMLNNVSDARDTQTMLRLLSSDEKTLDVLDAGTTMRFLTSLKAVSGENRIMTGTPRMCERPIGILVNALRELGAEIVFLKNEGYPPLELKGFKFSGKKRIQIKGDVSSQYISSLLMVSPLLQEGLELELVGHIASRPYILMTLELMRHFGIQYTFEGQIISIPSQKYVASTFAIESDWSGASYWYSVVALSSNAKVHLLGLKEDSLQGDSAIVGIMSKLGVKTEFDKDGAILTSIPSIKEISIDFDECPDLAQTIAAVVAAKGIKATFTGIESLKIKETDRVLALQNELKKMGASFIETSPLIYVITPGVWDSTTTTRFETYDDHRMAMAFAPLSLIQTVEIEHPDVVKKSYPTYWEHLAKAGFIIEEV